MNYNKTFNPQPIQTFQGQHSLAAADRLDQSIYVYNEEIILAVNVALATGRPLLVRGPSGCGKSTLARNAAQILGRRYYEHVVSSKTEARDLLWQVDLLRRLQDARGGNLAGDFTPYVVPGVLWWSFNRTTALDQIARTGRPNAPALEPGEYIENAKAVVLLDEIDKADPDVPNNLLVPLGSLTFHVTETGETVAASSAPLVFLTTNGERDLPPAFERRCVELKIAPPNLAQLISVGRAHFPSAAGDLLQRVAALFAGTATTGVTTDEAASGVPSTAEYLDTVRACIDLNVQPGSDVFETLSRVTVWKHGRTPAPGAGR